MATQPFYYKEESYGGSTIQIEVQRDTGTVDVDGKTITTHTLRGYIDDTLEVTEENPTDATPPIYPGILEKIDLMIDALKMQLDESDELQALLLNDGYTAGSEKIENYVVTPGSGSFSHSWTNDPDIDIESLEQADDAAFTVNLTLIHNGSLTPPVADTGYGSGVTKYFRIRGQRAGSDPGPWSYASGTTL